MWTQLRTFLGYLQARLARALDRRLVLLGLVSFVGLTVAFQFPYTYRLDIGDPSARQLVGDFYPAEMDGGRTIRWTRQHSTLLIPAVASGAWTLSVTLNTWQPKGPTDVRVSFNNAGVSTLNSDIEWKTFRQTANLQPGDALLVFQSATFRPTRYGSSDPRLLGVRVDTVALAPQQTVLRIPPLIPYVLPLSLSVMLLGVVMRELEFSWRTALGSALAGLLALMWFIGFFRIDLNDDFVRALGVGLALSWLLALALPLVATWIRRAGITVTPSGLGWLGLIVAGAFVVKLVGTFYPQIFIFDSLFQLHRLQFVMGGNLFFTTASREFQNLQTVYPPALYLFLLPLTRFIPDTLTLIKLFPIVLQTLNGFVLFLLARKNSLSERAALLAVFLYLFVPLSLIIFSWGVYANIFAQELFLITLTAWFLLPWAAHPRASALLLSFLVLVNLLAHASMAPMLLVFWPVFLALNWVFTRRAPTAREQRAKILWTVGALLLALATAFLLYYSFFLAKTLQDLATLQGQQVSTLANGFSRVVGSGLDDDSLGLMPIYVSSPQDLIGQGLVYLLREAWVYYRGLVAAAALAGTLWLWRNEKTRGLAFCLAAGFVMVLAFFLVGLGFNVYTRYMLFALPFIALGAGLAFDRLWQINRLTRGLTLLGIALLLQSSLELWIQRVLQ